MNTNTELWEYARQLQIPLRAVVTKDNLKKVPLQNGGYVINLQNDYHSDGTDLTGSHWTAFYIENGKAVYFNSFGIAPPVEVQLYLWRYKPLTYNTMQIQNIRSGWCGIYVLAFLKYMSSRKNIPIKKRFDKFLRLFDDDVEKNLKILKTIMGKQFFK